MNDVVLDLDLGKIAPPCDAARFQALSLAYITQLGCGLYAEDPLVHKNHPERARRLAALIVMKAPETNAALFVSPRAGARPEEVQARFANLSIDIIANLMMKQMRGALDTVSADNAVWRRLAA